MQPIIAIVIGLTAGIALTMLGVFMLRARAIRDARSRFGPEFHTVLKDTGSRHKAAVEMRKREKRVDHLKLTPLTAEAREAFDARWAQVKAGFIESPLGAANSADALIDDVLTARGYPEGKFEQRAADLSVHHPELIDGFRTAHDLALRDGEDDLDTEDLRQAVLAYKALYESIASAEPLAEEPLVQKVISHEPIAPAESIAEPIEVESKTF